MTRIAVPILVFILLSGLTASLSCVPQYSLSDLSIKPAVVYPDEEVLITAYVSREPKVATTIDIVLRINGIEEETRSVELEAGPNFRRNVNFRVSRSNPGEYDVTIGDIAREGMYVSGSFTVLPYKAIIRVEITTSTWIDYDPKDIQSVIEGKLRGVGFKVASRDVETFDAILFVDYRETKGEKYRGEFFGGGTGTDIHCSLELYDSTDKLIWEDTVSASPSSSIAVSSTEGAVLALRRSAFTRLKNSDRIKHLGETILDYVLRETNS